MRVPSWLRPLAARLNPTRQRTLRLRPSFQPRVELLEDRVVPTAMMLQDINPSGNGIVNSSYAVVNGTALFAADDGVHGQELWKTDGTPSGTVLVKDIDPNDSSGVGSVQLSHFFNVNGRLLFEVDDPVNDPSPGVPQLWTSDGTAGGTVPFAGAPAAGFSLNSSVVAGNFLYFAGNDGVHGYELWRSDGTVAGTSMVKDINPGSASGYPIDFMVFGSRLMFTASPDSGLHNGLWITDGTDSGTTELATDVHLVVPNNTPSSAVLNGELYFGQYTPTLPFGPQPTYSLWKTDGTAAGTVQVKATIGPTEGMIVLNGKLLFGGSDTTNLSQPLPGLFSSDGTAAGTVPPQLDVGFGPATPVLLGGTVLFDGGSSLWKTDGTSAGTVPLKTGFSSLLYAFTVVDGRLFFTADDGTHGREIWSSDGTELGTVLALDINPGSGSSQPLGFSIPPMDDMLIPLGNTLVFAADDGVHGLELWSAFGDHPPVASAAPLTQTVPEGTPAQFDASASSDPDGDPLTYLWDFNGDGMFVASGTQVSHAYGDDGVYPVTLKVMDGFGLSATTTVNVSVTEVQPTAIISTLAPPATDASGNWTSPEGQGIPLNGSLTDPGWLDLQSGISFTWGVTKNGVAYQSATGQDYWFVPDDNGTYVVTLSVTDKDGSGSVSQTIDVTNVAPTAHLRVPAGLTALPAGALDPNFGSGGTVITGVTGDDLGGSFLAQQPDGKIVAAGSVTIGYDQVYAFAVARYLPDGTPDPTFGQNGMVVTDLGLDASDNPVGVVVQPDGKVVVAGSSGASLALLRLNPDGTLDTSFGPAHTGFVITPGADAAVVALQDGNILVAGGGSDGAFTLLRYTADGTLDPTFGDNGTGIVQFLPNQPDLTSYYGASAMTVQGGQIYLAGLASTVDDRFFDQAQFVAVIRLDADGHLDASYGGSVTPALSVDYPGQSFNRLATPGWAFAEESDYDWASPAGLVLQSDGEAIVGGGMGLFRFTADGSSGALVPDTPGGSVITQPDGKLLVWGSGYDSTTNAYFVDLTRLNPDLSPDTTFGPNGDGQATPGLNSDPSILPGPSSALLQSDGNVLLAVDTRLNDGAYYPFTGSYLTRVVGQATPGQEVHEGDTIPLTGTATDPGGADVASLTYAWAVTKDGTAYQTASGPNYQFTPDDNGTYVVTLTVTDKDGGSSSDSHTFSVANVAPTANVSAPSGSAVAGEVLTFTLGASDPSSVDQAAGFTYQIDWDGDGTTDQTVTGPASFTINHSYAAGSYTVRVRAEDKDGDFGPWASASVTVNPVTPDNLQSSLSPDSTVTIETTTPQQAHDAIAAANGLDPATTPAATLVVDLGGQTIQDTTVNVPPQVTLTFINGTFIGGSPALVVCSGIVVVTNSTFNNATDAPTILVTGGQLKLRDDIIQESTGYNQAAIRITGGTVDLGTADDPGGNTLNVNGAGVFIQNSTSAVVNLVGETFTMDGGAVAPSSLSGLVFEDFNDDGQVDFGEEGIAGVNITLSGVDALGQTISLTQTTDSDGAYVFLNLWPGSYYLTETQPAGYTQGIDSVGTAGGSLSATDQFFVQLPQGVNGLNYNFGEQPTATGPVQKGQTAGIGFWNNKNGQALILAFNGGTGSQLADWLAATLPNMFGANAGSNNLAGQSNAYVAALFQQDFLMKGVKLDAQVLATALSVYATNATLDSTAVAAQYGFVVSGDGVGTATVNVGSNGDAFGVANNTTLTVMDLLLATDNQAINGILYGGSAAKRNEANAVYSAINQAGNIS